MEKIKTLFSALYRSQVILWIGILLIVLICLFPPWLQPYPHANGSNFMGYYFLMFPPDDGYQLDFGRLGLQCGIVAIITGGLLYTLKDKKTETGGK